jgi:hypothetical protein
MDKAVITLENYIKKIGVHGKACPLASLNAALMCPAAFKLSLKSGLPDYLTFWCIEDSVNQNHSVSVEGTSCSDIYITFK